jgi:hypothetical protein
MMSPPAETPSATSATDPGEVLRIEMRPVANLTAHPANYRRHPEHQLAILRESLRVHGQQKPVVVTPDGTILAGHGLVQAAKLEGWERIACHVYWLRGPDVVEGRVSAPHCRVSSPATGAKHGRTEDRITGERGLEHRSRRWRRHRSFIQPAPSALVAVGPHSGRRMH